MIIDSLTLQGVFLSAYYIHCHYTSGDTMTVSDWATTLSGFLAVAAAFGATTRWAFRKYIHTVKDEILVEAKEILEEVVQEYLIELKPNHGSSLNDTIKLEILPLIREMSKDIIDVKVCQARLEGRFEQHVDEVAE